VAPILNTGDKKVTFAVHAQSVDLDQINIIPAAADALSLTAPGAQVAGTAFAVTASVIDDFGNATETNCTASGLLDVTGGVTSAGGHGATATAPTLPVDVAQSALG